MAFGRARAKDLEGEINLTSLIDILFIVLIFLMLTTSFASRSGVEISLPKSSQQREAAAPDMIEIELNASGEIFIKGQKRTLEELQAFLAETPDKELPLALRADELARHGRVVEILDTIRGAGFRKLGIEARAK